MKKDVLICVGMIISSHGIKGAVKIKTFLENPKSIEVYGAVIDNKNNKYQVSVLSELSPNLIIAQIDSIKTRTEADKLRNIKLYVKRNQLPVLNSSDEFYSTDLIGMKVVLQDNSFYGYIKNVNNFGSGDIVEISFSHTERTVMLPFAQDIFTEINLKENYVMLILPEIMGEESVKF